MGVHRVEKFFEFACPVTVKALSHYTARRHIQGSEQGCGSVPLVIVTSSFCLYWPHGQDGLSAIQRLNLTFLVHTKHQGMIRWIHVQPYNVANLLYEPRVVGKLK